MDILEKKYTMVYQKDYPLEFDEFNKQKVLKNIDAAIPMIMRLLHCKVNTLPSLPDLFLDIERYKHVLMSTVDQLAVDRDIKQKLNKCFNEFQPEVVSVIDRFKQKVDITITLHDEYSMVKISVLDSQSRDDMKIYIDKKAFYK